jgi:hypothetical protein
MTSQATAPAINPYHAQALATFDARLKESQMFHTGGGSVRDTVMQLAKDLRTAGIDYAIVGGMALNAHGYARETTDVDVLVTSESLDVFRNTFVGKGYRPAFEGARKTFRNTRTGVKVEFLITGEYPGDGKPKPVAFPDPSSAAVTIDEARVITLEKLIELKLASGMTSRARRIDLADVQSLIKVLRLDESFAERLDPYVRPMFLELLDELRSDDRREE